MILRVFPWFLRLLVDRRYAPDMMVSDLCDIGGRLRCHILSAWWWHAHAILLCARLLLHSRHNCNAVNVGHARKAMRSM